MAEDRLTTLYNWSEEMTKAGEAVKDKVSVQNRTALYHRSIPI